MFLWLLLPALAAAALLSINSGYAAIPRAQMLLSLIHPGARTLRSF
jgi:hypothetical protein